MDLKNFVKGTSGGEYTAVRSYVRRARPRPRIKYGMLLLFFAVAVVASCFAKQFVVLMILACFVTVIICGLRLFGKRKRIFDWIRRFKDGEL